MFEDITPPKKTQRFSNARPVLRSLKWRNHTLDQARERLASSESHSPKPPPLKTSPERPEPPRPIDSEPSERNDSQAKARKRDWFGWWHHRSHLQRFAIVSLALLVFGGGACGAYYLAQPKSEPSIEISKKPKAKEVVPATVASPLSGVQVPPDLAKRSVTAIMIENSLDARPQSGLLEAGVIFEAIAEGGITRFLTLFQDTRPQYIGPVRSLRPYYLDWAAAFDAGIAHVGGSPEALKQVRGGMKDLDQFFNAGSFWRVSTRAAPHNVYTSFERLDALNKSKGYTSSTFASWPRKADSALNPPTAKTIDVNISSARYNSHYDYDAASNSYLRSEGGAPHKATTSADDTVGQQLHPKVVIALVMAYSIVDGAGHSGYATSGSGGMSVFQDGGVTSGTWSKAERKSQFEFKDAAGAPLKLNAGQAWVVIVSDPGKIVSAP